jgi:hypothetical protein
MKYTKKPVTIDAIQWTGTNKDEIRDFCGESCIFNNIRINKVKFKEALLIGTLEGIMEASIGDYIIKGIKGEFYPCKPDIFELTYTKNE